MRNETARREIESLDYYLQNHTDDYSEESHTAMLMAVDALNNADVLEQIRNEIEQSWDGYLLTDNQSFEGVPAICINHALDIIDKYRG